MNFFINILNEIHYSSLNDKFNNLTEIVRDFPTAVMHSNRSYSSSPDFATYIDSNLNNGDFNLSSDYDDSLVDEVFTKQKVSNEYINDERISNEHASEWDQVCLIQYY